MCVTPAPSAASALDFAQAANAADRLGPRWHRVADGWRELAAIELGRSVLAHLRAEVAA